MSVITSRNDPVEPIVLPRGDPIDKTEFWINVLHRRTVQDARSIADLTARVSYLERRRWWNRRTERRC